MTRKMTKIEFLNARRVGVEFEGTMTRFLRLKIGEVAVWYKPVFLGFVLLDDKDAESLEAIYQAFEEASDAQTTY